MAWTAPRTWVTSEVVTASLFNTHMRDNLLETAPAKATTANGIFVATGANAIAERVPTTGTVVTTAETTTSGSFTDLATSGPAVTVTTGTVALIFISARIATDTAADAGIMDFAVSGATTRSASDGTALKATSSVAADDYRSTKHTWLDTLTAGSNTFTCKYRTTNGGVATSTFANRTITVIPL